MKNRSGSPGTRLMPGLLSLKTAISSADRTVVSGLLVANMVPVVLVFVFAWNVGDVVMFYWWENIIIGLFTIPRIAFAAGAGMQPARQFLVPFFVFHYFFFCFVHVIFVRLLFQDGGRMFGKSPFVGSVSELIELVPAGGFVGLLALVISHGLSFRKNFIQAGEYKTAIAGLEMFRPYGRVVVLHVCIIFGGLAVQALGSPLPMVVMLMVGKTMLDLTSHCVVHSASQNTKMESVQDHR